MSDILAAGGQEIMESPRAPYPELYVKGDDYIVYFKVMKSRTTEELIAYISSYKFCGAYNNHASDITLLEFHNDDIRRMPNAQIVRKSVEDVHSPMATFLCAVRAVESGGHSNHHLTNENRVGIRVFAEHDKTRRSLKIFNVDLLDLSKEINLYCEKKIKNKKKNEK